MPNLAPAPREAHAARPVALGLLALLLAAAEVACAPRASRPSVLVVTLDTVRADRIGCYGYGPARTPHLDALAAAGVRFTRAYTPAPLTLPAHASLLTGRYPPRHGVLHNGLYRLPDNVPTLAERFRRAGYRTAAFVASTVLNRTYGLARGFERYEDVPTRPPSLERLDFAPGERDARAVTALALDWLQAQGQVPVFLWVHYYDPHAPYLSHGPDPGDRALRYDREIAYVDEALGLLLQGLERQGAQWIVVVAADHGEALGEHGELTHGYFVYEEVMRVPLLVRGPSVPAGRLVDAPASLVDVGPTLLELAGLGELPEADGESLVPLWQEPAAPEPATERAVYMEARMAYLEYGWSPLFALRRGSWKFIEAPRPELYDLGTDPREARNLYPEPPASALQGMLAGLRAALQQRGAGESARREVSPEELARLRSLGYLQAGPRPAQAPAGGSLPDPKDKLAVFRQLDAATVLAAEGRALEAAAVLESLVREDPSNPVVRERLVLVLLAARRYDEAGQQAREGLGVLEARGLPFVSGMRLRMLLANVCHRQGKLDEAARLLDEVLERHPDEREALRQRMYLDISLGRPGDAVARARRYAASLPEDAAVSSEAVRIAARAGDDEAVLELGLPLLDSPYADPEALVEVGSRLERRGEGARAERAYRRAVDQNPATYRAWWGLGRLAFARGDGRQALEAFRRATEAEPRHATAWYNLGLAASRLGDTEQAEGALTRALELDPAYLDARVALAELEERTGRHDEACRMYRSVLEAAPGDATAREGASRACRGSQ